MEHAEAQESHAAGRYILDEMSESERDGFEEHYFGCAICAEDVIAGTRLMDSGRAIARETASVVPIAPRRSPLLTWMPLAASAILVLGALLIIPQRSAQPSLAVLTPHAITVGQSRGAEEAPLVLRAGKPGLIVVDVLANEPFPRYEASVRDSAGKVVMTTPLSAEEAQTIEGIHLLLPSLPRGSYVLTLHGVSENGNRTVVVDRPFRVQ